MLFYQKLTLFIFHVIFKGGVFGKNSDFYDDMNSKGDVSKWKILIRSVCLRITKGP